MNPFFSLLPRFALLLAVGGCSVLAPKPELTSPTPLVGSPETERLNAVAKAAQSNSIVLQVIGAEQPVRILPLPEDGRNVFVSDLLRQSGASDSFARMQAILYRQSPDRPGGVRMGVRFIEGTNTVAPEHDYVLRPGDRLQVVEEERSPLDELFNMFGTTNSRRAVVGF